MSGRAPQTVRTGRLDQRPQRCIADHHDFDDQVRFRAPTPERQRVGPNLSEIAMGIAPVAEALESTAADEILNARTRTERIPSPRSGALR